jgi:hypothetical protein
MLRKDNPNVALESVEWSNPFDVYDVEGRLLQPKMGSYSPGAVVDRNDAVSEPVSHPSGDQFGDEIGKLSRNTDSRVRLADSQIVGQSNTQEVRFGNSSLPIENKPLRRMPGSDEESAVRSSWCETSFDASHTRSAARLQAASPRQGGGFRNEAKDSDDQNRVNFDLIAAQSEIETKAVSEIPVNKTSDVVEITEWFAPVNDPSITVAKMVTFVSTHPRFKYGRDLMATDGRTIEELLETVNIRPSLNLANFHFVRKILGETSVYLTKPAQNEPEIFSLLLPDLASDAPCLEAIRNQAMEQNRHLDELRCQQVLLSRDTNTVLTIVVSKLLGTLILDVVVSGRIPGLNVSTFLTLIRERVASQRRTRASLRKSVQGADHSRLALTHQAHESGDTVATVATVSVTQAPVMSRLSTEMHAAPYHGSGQATQMFESGGTGLRAYHDGGEGSLSVSDLKSCQIEHKPRLLVLSDEGLEYLAKLVGRWLTAYKELDPANKQSQQKLGDAMAAFLAEFDTQVTSLKNKAYLRAPIQEPKPTRDVYIAHPLRQLLEYLPLGGKNLVQYYADRCPSCDSWAKYERPAACYTFVCERKRCITGGGPGGPGSSMMTRCHPECGSAHTQIQTLTDADHRESDDRCVPVDGRTESSRTLAWIMNSVTPTEALNRARTFLGAGNPHSERAKCPSKMTPPFFSRFILTCP